MKPIPETKPPKTVLLTAICLGIVFGISRLPESLLAAVRAGLLDSTVPIQRLHASAKGKWDSWTESITKQQNSKLSQLQSELAMWKRAARLQQIAQAEQQEQSERELAMGTSSFSSTSSPSLLVPELIRANVISSREVESFERSLLIERTSRQPIDEGSFVIDSSAELLVDQGTDVGLESEHPVYSGRCVIGRLVDVGRWISRVQLTTDQAYRGRAQVLRAVDGKFSYGPEGILEGTGTDMCRLRYIGREESVRVGDHVYTSTRSALLPEPMYYGAIVKAELDETSREWNIEIEPAMQRELLRYVDVLKQSVNPARVLGN